MVTICLLRHGETVYNADGNRYCGRTDVDLTPIGITQAKRMRSFLSEYMFDAVFSSPLKRAKDTALIATGFKDIVTEDNRLIEIDFGEWEGLKPEEFQLADSSSWSDWLEDPTVNRAGKYGETAREVLQRLDSFYEEILEKYNDKTVLVVGHNGVNRLFMASRLGMPLKNYRKIVQDNSALTLLTLSKSKGMKLLKLNA